MKAKFLLFVLGIFCCMDIAAIEKEIPIQRTSDDKAEWVKDERSVILEPTATIDGGTIRIYTNVTTENVSIVVKDQFENVMQSSVDVLSSRCHTFELHDLPAGDYVLVLTIGESSYDGDFFVPDDI